ncbi:MAG: GNVR domain-containing protein [Pyrinomonadaceae bacterium]
MRYREALAREQDLRIKFNAQRDEVLLQNEAAINYRIIQQDIDTNKALFNDLLQRLKENDLVLTGTSNNILVLDRARTQWTPVGPERMQYIVLAFFAALISAVGLALLVNFA